MRLATFLIVCVSCARTISLGHSIRTNSIVWRNDANQIVKQVIYSPESAFQPMRESELDEFRSLPYGYIYKAHDDSKRVHVRILRPASVRAL